MEIWKDASGFEDIYEVSDKGRVRSKCRVVVMSKVKSGRLKTYRGFKWQFPDSSEEAAKIMSQHKFFK